MLEANTAGHKQSGSFMECIEDKLLLQMIKKPMRKGAGTQGETGGAVTMDGIVLRPFGQQGGFTGNSL